MSETVPDLPTARGGDAGSGGGGGGGGGGGSKPPARPPTLNELAPDLTTAIITHLGLVNAFESSEILGNACMQIRHATDIFAAAVEPIRQKMIGLDAAIRWGFTVERLLHLVGDAVKAPGLPFDVSRYNQTVAQVYDIGFKEMIVDPITEPLDSDSDPDEDDDSEEEEDDGDTADV